MNNREHLISLIIENGALDNIDSKYRDDIADIAREQYNLIKSGQILGDREQEFFNKYKNEYVKTMDFSNAKENELFKDFAKDVLAEHNNLSKEEVTYAAWYFTRKKYIENDFKVKMEIKDIPSKSVNSVTLGQHYHNRDTNVHEIKYNGSGYIDKIVEDCKGFSNKNRNIFALLWTINHEFQHAVQHESYGEETFDYNMLQYAKESICYEEYGKEFYKGNYSKISFEHDANINGYYRTLEDLKEYAPQHVADFEKSNIDEKRKLVNKFGKEKYEFSVEEEKINQSVKSAVTIGVNAAAKSNWEEIIKRYPILLNEYNLDGSKKDYKEITEDRELRIEQLEDQGELFKRVKVHGVEMSKNMAVQKMYANIIASDPLLSIQELEYKLVDTMLSGKNAEQCNEIKGRIKSIAKDSTIDYKNLMNYQKKRMTEIEKKRKNLQKEYNSNKIDQKSYFQQDNALVNEETKIREVYNEVILSNDKLTQEDKKTKDKEEQIKKSKSIIKEKLGLDIDKRTDNTRRGFTESEKGLVFNGYSEEELFEKIQQYRNNISGAMINYTPNKRDEAQIVLNSLNAVYSTMKEQRSYTEMTKRLEKWKEDKNQLPTPSKTRLLEQINGLSDNEYKKAQQEAAKNWDIKRANEMPNKEKRELSNTR